MHKGVVLGLVAALAIPVGVVIYQAMGAAGARVGSFLTDHDLEGAAGQVRQADEHLTAMVREKLGQSDEIDREIDLLNPTEADLRFLLDLLKDGTDPQRASAARALVTIGDPRSVRPLLRATTTSDDPAFFCLASQQILRHQTRAGAAEWILDAVLDPELPMTEACRQELADKLAVIDAGADEVLVELLFSERPRVQEHALRALRPGAGGVEAQRRAEELSQSGQAGVAGAAKAWLGGVDHEPSQTAPTQN